MVTTIFKYEWKQFIRSKGIVAALLVFTAIGFFCLHQGKSVYHFQQVSADSALAKKQRNFEKVKNDNVKAWNTYLNRINIEAPQKQKEIFYTSLYHLFLQPSNITDVDGNYRCRKCYLCFCV